MQEVLQPGLHRYSPNPDQARGDFALQQVKQFCPPDYPDCRLKPVTDEEDFLDEQAV
jgi:hypothetical protein